MSMKRPYIFTCVAALLLYALRELISFGAYYVYTGQAVSFAWLRSSVAERASGINYDSLSSSDTEGRPAPVYIHPYTGIAPIPGLRDMGKPFLSARDQDNALFVGVTGGSVSQWWLGDKPAIDVLRRKLNEIPQFRGRTIEIVMLGLPGFKQPQQVIAVLLYQLFGGHLDILINLDGNNEVLGPEANQRSHVFYGFPAT